MRLERWLQEVLETPGLTSIEDRDEAWSMQAIVIPGGAHRPGLVVVSDHHVVEEVAPCRDRSERRTHSPSTNEQDAHQTSMLCMTCLRRV